MKAYEFDGQPFFHQLLTDTMVELKNPKDQSALVKKLKAAGIFLRPRSKAAKDDEPVSDSD